MMIKQGIDSDVNFGHENPKSPANGPVISYRLSDEELERLRRETNWMPVLTKDEYLEMRDKGMSDADIRKKKKIDHNILEALKTQWGLDKKIMKTKEKEDKTENETGQNEATSKITVGTIKDMTIMGEIKGPTFCEIKEMDENPILKDVLDLLIGQTKKGIEKYGTTVNPIDYSLSEWIDHVLQEKIDEIVYLVTIKHKIKSII